MRVTSRREKKTKKNEWHMNIIAVNVGYKVLKAMRLICAATIKRKL